MGSNFNRIRKKKILSVTLEFWIMLVTFLVCCCFDSVLICDTNFVNTSSFEIAEINIFNASRTPHLSLQPG